ncbi:MAG: hypothetical protein ACLS3M_03620 [Collinsella sp.]
MLADVGCSTGGFTIACSSAALRPLSRSTWVCPVRWSLRQDDRVTLHERTNVTQLPELGYGGAIDLACAMCRLQYREYHRRGAGVSEAFGFVLHAVKPQFEAPAALVGEAAS